MSIEQKLYEEELFQLQSLFNDIISIYERFAVENSVFCLTLIFNLSDQKNENPAPNKLVQGSYTIFSEYCYKPMAL